MLLLPSPFSASAKTSVSSCGRCATDGGKKIAPPAGFGDGVRERDPLPRPPNPTCWTERCEIFDEARGWRSDMRQVRKLLQVSFGTSCKVYYCLLISEEIGATRWRAGRCKNARRLNAAARARDERRNARSFSERTRVNEMETPTRLHPRLNRRLLS